MWKKALCLIFAFLLSIESFAAVVSDNDGSAFITKAEFDSLKNNFQSQIDQYNSNIDNKIDSAIAQYLAGIKVQKTETKNLMLWGGRKLGLIENEKARPYVEGNVGGRLDFTLYAALNRDGHATGGKWSSGITTVSDDVTANCTPTWFKTCFHRMTANSSPFKYLIVDVNKTGSDYFFNLAGYANVTEEIVGLHRTHKEADLTQRFAWTIGLCSGFYSQRNALETKATSYTGNFAQFCECTNRSSGLGSYATRGTAFNDHHNEYLLTWQDITLSSEPTIQNNVAYITNAASGTAYNGIRTRDWHGINATNGTTETHTKGDVHMWGWNVDTRGSTFNFHIDARPYDAKDMFDDGAGVFNRVMQADPSYSAGSYGHYPSTMAHGVVSDNTAFHKLYKADIGGQLKSNNLYSNELADVIKTKVKTGLINKSFNGTNLDVSPLYLGLPLLDVKEDDTVEIELELLDNDANYDIGFTVGGFWNQPVMESSYEDSGCNLAGGVGHIATSTATGSARKVKLKVEIKKSGILFMKYGASDGTTQDIQLPTTCTVTKG